MSTTIKIYPENELIDLIFEVDNNLGKTYTNLLYSIPELLKALGKLCNTNIDFLTNTAYDEPIEELHNFMLDIDFIIPTIQNFIDCVSSKIDILLHIEEYKDCEEWNNYINDEIFNYHLDTWLNSWREYVQEGWFIKDFNLIIKCAKFFKKKGAQKVYFLLG